MDRTLWCVIAALGISVACSSGPQPTERLVSAQAAMRAAKEVGVTGVPQAELHAQLAQEQLEKAQKLIADGENESADRLLRRATADAELALAITREAQAKQAAQQAEGTASPGGAH
jgi:hypothetical protein